MIETSDIKESLDYSYAYKADELSEAQLLARRKDQIQGFIVTNSMANSAKMTEHCNTRVDFIIDECKHLVDIPLGGRSNICRDCGGFAKFPHRHYAICLSCILKRFDEAMAAL